MADGHDRVELEIDIDATSSGEREDECVYLYTKSAFENVLDKCNAAAAIKVAPAEKKSEQLKLGNSLSAAHKRLYHDAPKWFYDGHSLHTASHDVVVMEDVLQHSAIEEVLNVRAEDDTTALGITTGIQWVVERAQVLNAAHIASYLGWAVEHLPKCPHGVMTPKVVKQGSDANEWLVMFRCRLGSERCEVKDISAKGYHESFDVSTLAAVRKSASKGKEPVGTAGACRCSGKCKRASACACVTAGVQCTQLCNGHKAPKCKCTNRASSETV
jgi:hypothetical protein